MSIRSLFAVGALAAATFPVLAGVARADDAASELATLRRQLETQGRRLAVLENAAPSAEEISAAVDRYLATSPGAALVGGDATKGSAGFPLGKRPFIKEGPNKLEFMMRGQVRWSTFLYSDDAVGTLASPAMTVADQTPRDRSGFEIERWHFGFQGNLFCEDISYNFFFNFDSDTGTGLEKEFAFLDWRYHADHHIRGGVDKIPFTYEEYSSSGSLAFVDRSIFAKAFGLDSDTGVMLWGTFGDCNCPKRFLYRFFASTGEGGVSVGSTFNTDAFDTFSDQLLFTGALEWNVTCKDWAWDGVDHRACADRCGWDVSIGVSGYHENDDDAEHRAAGLALRSSGRIDRTGINAWIRARHDGWTFLAEYARRIVDYKSGAPEQVDEGAHFLVHHRFADSNWGVGARVAAIFLDDDYTTLSIGPTGGPFTAVAIEDTIWEAAVVLNYFFWDHSHKVSLDVSWIQDNSAVSSSSAGYLANPSRGVVVEDGIMIRVQWQLQI